MQTEIEKQINELKEQRNIIDNKMRELYKSARKQVQREPNNFEIEKCEEICRDCGIEYEEIFIFVRYKSSMVAKRKIVRHFHKLWYTYERIALLIGLTNHASIKYLLEN